MRESIGTVQLYNIIIVFFFVVMTIMIGAIAYHRSFRVNIAITDSIEKYEGFNNLARSEIKDRLEVMAYSEISGSPSCPAHWGDATLHSPSSSTEDYTHDYCVYISGLESVIGPLNYRQYTIVTFVAFDIPMSGIGGIPIVSKTNKIFCFDDCG